MPISRKAASRRMPAHFGRLALLALFAGVICLISVPLPLRAAGSQLVGGSVSPGHGTTATSFVFIVDYASGPARDAQSVRAEIGDADMTLDLALVGGNAAGGTWRASSALPPGAWTVTFRAVAIGLDPTLTLTDAVVVTQATSPPTLPPSPPPTQAPTPRSSPRPQPTVPPTPHPPVPTAQPTGPPGSTATSPTTAAQSASPTAGTSGGGASPASSSTLPASASAGASLAASPVVVARRPDATPAGATPGVEPIGAATPTPEATDATSASASIGRNAWLLLGGSLAVLGSGILARQWLRRRSRPSAKG